MMSKLLQYIYICLEIFHKSAFRKGANQGHDSGGFPPPVRAPQWSQTNLSLIGSVDFDFAGVFAVQELVNVPSRAPDFVPSGPVRFAVKRAHRGPT